MTEEEKAAKEYGCKLFAEKVNNKEYDKDGHILYSSKDITDAFLAGTKLRKIKTKIPKYVYGSK